MKKKILKNGLTVICDKRNTDSVTVEVIVKVGSNNEDKKIYGISHFIEHMLFEGTVNRTTMQIANEIEKLGGEMNAATSNERTFFYIHVLKKHLDKALDILSDIIQNPLFDEKAIEKERNILLDEISLVNDDPKFYQWILFEKTLFEKHPAKNPAYGTRETVKKISRKDILNYYNKYYVPNNMIVVVSGMDNVFDKIKKKFIFEKKELARKKKIKEPKQRNIKKKIERRNIEQSYMVFGYKACGRDNKDSYVLDVIQAILGKGQSGRLFEEVRIKQGLAYSVGAHYDENVDYGSFAAYAGADKKNLEKIRGIFIKQFKLPNLADKEINDAKTYIEGNFKLKLEENKERADILGFWDMVKDAKLAKEYVSNVKKVSRRDILRVVKKYFNGKYTEVVVRQR